MDAHMQNLLDELIFNCPDDRRYWVVRASGGLHVRCFHRDSVVAIGHVDQLRLPAISDPSSFDYFQLREALGKVKQDSEKHRSSASVTSHANQVKTFVAEIEEGDFVITLDSSELSIGQVASAAYISHNPILHGTAPNILKMEYQLRRNVNWGPILKRKELPSGMNDSLHAHQAVFNIDKYWAAVHHLVFPYFRRGDDFYFTRRIQL
jgi:predicted Mrr-cat superfamily restriction endonuclease